MQQRVVSGMRPTGRLHIGHFHGVLENWTIGCVECKKILAGHLNERLEPFREKRIELSEQPDFVDHLLRDGSERASKISDSVMAEVRSALKL